jgi:hypothetical protein
MSRYSTGTIILDENGKRYFNTIILPNPAGNTTDIFIQTTTPDRLDKLALIFYEDETMWWVIAAANGLGKGTYMVPADTRLRIPDIADIQQVIIDTNNER